MKMTTALRTGLLSCACLLLAACGGGDAGVSTAAERPVAATAAPAPKEARTAPSDEVAVAETAGTQAGTNGRVLEQEYVYGATEEHNLVGLFYAPEDIIEPLPGVVLVHDWWGLDDSVKAAARELAGAGYAVLAVDLYGGSVATTAADAEVLMRGVMSDREGTLANLRQAYDYLRQYALAPRVAAIGWHLGGTWALESAIELEGRLDAVVVYYGQVVNDESRLKKLATPLLGIFAENDEVVPLRFVRDFRNSLRDLHKRADVYIYSGVGHGFANSARPSYDASAAAEAWDAMLSFLDRELKPDGGAETAPVPTHARLDR